MKIYIICNIGNLGDKEEIVKTTDEEKTGTIEIIWKIWKLGFI